MDKTFLFGLGATIVFPFLQYAVMSMSSSISYMGLSLGVTLMLWAIFPENYKQFLFISSGAIIGGLMAWGLYPEIFQRTEKSPITMSEKQIVKERQMTEEKQTPITMGKDNTIYGNVRIPANMGDGNTIIGPTDANRNTIIRPPANGMAVGHGAYAGPGGLSMGAGAGAGQRPKDDNSTQKDK